MLCLSIYHYCKNCWLHKLFGKWKISFFVDSNINSIYVYKWPCLDRIEKCTIYWLKGHPELKSLSSVSFDNLLKKKYVWVQINYSHLNYLISWSISMHCWLFRSRGLATTELNTLCNIHVPLYLWLYGSHAWWECLWIYNN